MGRSCWVIHLLLMCSLRTKLIAVNAQSVTISKVTPVGDPVEGNVVELRCQAAGLIVGGIINSPEWNECGFEIHAFYISGVWGSK